MDRICPNCHTDLSEAGNDEWVYCPGCRKVVSPQNLKKAGQVRIIGHPHHEDFQERQMGYMPQGYHPIAQRYDISRHNPFPDTGKGNEELMKTISQIGMLFFLILISMNLISLAYSIYYVPKFINEAELTPLYFLIPFPPFIVGFPFYLTGNYALAYFYGLAATIFLSFIFLYLQDRRKILSKLFNLPFYGNQGNSMNYGSAVPEENLPEANMGYGGQAGLNSSGSKEADDESGFVLIGELFMALVFINVVFKVLITLLGKTMHIPDFITEAETWEKMIGLARASVWEEVLLRIFYIGIPLFIISAATGSKFKKKPPFSGKSEQKDAKGRQAPRANKSAPHQYNDVPKWYNLLLGGKMDITPTTTGLIFISSVLFGLAHASSWDYLKVIPAITTGFAFGYLFVKKGVHTAIILHFAFDYLGIFSEILSGYPETTAMVVTGIIVLVMILMGSVMFYKYFMKAFNGLQEMFFNRGHGGRNRDPPHSGVHENHSRPNFEDEEHRW